MRSPLRPVFRLTSKQIIRVWLVWYVVYAVYLACNLSKNPPVISSGLTAFIVLLPMTFVVIPTYLVRAPLELVRYIFTEGVSPQNWKIENVNHVSGLVLFTSLFLIPSILSTAKEERKGHWSWAVIITALAGIYSLYTL